jgi:serine/threonine protein kinase
MNNPLPSGTLLQDGNYRIQSLHRMGGQSVVYEGINVESGQQIIIKQTYEDQEWSHAVVQQEASLLSGLQHRLLPRVLDCFSESGSTFLVMSRVPGCDVGELLKRRGDPFPYTEVLGWANQLLDILEYLQAQEPVIVHRDINPKNIRLTPDNQIFLLDFGIAKRIDSKTFLIGGTPHYAPPEQLKDEGTDQRTDLYALAATLYFLLTAKEPPDSLSRESTILKGLPDLLRPACELNTEIPLLISQVLSRTLSLERERRPNDAADMRKWLNQAVDGGYCDEEVTQVYTADEADSEITHTSVRDSVRVVVPFDTATGRDVTPEAQQLISSLDDGYNLEPGHIRIMIELIDSQPSHRKEILTRYSKLLRMSQDGKSEAAISLIYKLASDSYIVPEVRIRLRQKLGRFLADHTLSEISADTGKQDVAELKNITSPLDAATIQRHLIHRQWLRGLAFWFVRGIFVSIVIQLILSLFSGRRTALSLMSAGNSRFVWGTHLLFIGFSGLFVFMLRKINVSNLQSKKEYKSALHIVGFCFGAYLSIVLFHDILWALGLTK